MKTSTIIAIIVGIIIIAGGVWFVFMRNQAPATVVTPPDETPVVTTQSYASTTMGIAFQYPQGYTVNENYAYNQFGPSKLIHGVSVTIPQSMATGTNLSSDSYVSVEQLPNAKNCTGDIFLLDNVKAQPVTDGTINYSVASSGDAGAGNLYNETVYALTDSKPCTAVRYMIHSTQFLNYPAGTVTEFDLGALTNSFDMIRRSLVVSAPAI